MFDVLITDFGSPHPVTVFGNRSLPQALWDAKAVAAMAGTDGVAAPLRSTPVAEGESHAWELHDDYGPMPARLSIVRRASLGL